MPDIRATTTQTKKTTDAKASTKKSTSKTQATATSTIAKKGATAQTRVDTRSRVTPEERQRMIAEAAYLMAERRGFAGGDPNQDWLAAEAEIDRIISRT